MFIFNAVDGNDAILNFGAGDSLSINSGTVQSASASGNDFIITVASDDLIGTVTLKDVDAAKIRQSNGVFVFDAPGRILNRADSTKVVGTALNDSITNTGDKVTLNGGVGNDIITGSAYGEVFQFSSDGGRDLITNFGANDTLQITGGAIQSTVKNGNDVIVNVAGNLYNGAITLGGAGNLVLKRDDNFIMVEELGYITNTEDRKKITGTSGADFITNSGDRVTLQGGGGGNDVIVTLKGATKTGTVTLENAAGLNIKQSGKTLYVDGVNQIVNSLDAQKIIGTSRADYIINTGENVTVQSGKGADTIIGSDYGEMFAFSSADDDNVILNFSAGDTLKMTQGKTIAFEQSGDDYVVTLSGSKYTSHVTLEGAAANGTLRKSGSNALIMTASRASSAELPSDDYRFMSEAAEDELGEMINDAPLDNSLAMLEQDSAISIASARKIDLAVTAVHHQSKR